MAKKPAAASERIDLRGMMAVEIADLIVEGTISQKDAEKFVSDRAVNKLRTKIAQAQES